MKRSTVPLAALRLSMLLSGSALAVSQAPLPARLGLIPDPPSPLAQGKHASRTQGDTLWWGDYEVIGGEYYARSALNDRAAVTWTFDRGTGPFNPPAPYIHNGGGWKAIDRTANTVEYWRVIDSTLDLGEGVAPPLIAGEKSLWVGADKPQADEMCWACGAGYGNRWCQRVLSEMLPYNGTSTVRLEMLYFNDSEWCYDGTQIYLRRADGVEILLNEWMAQCAPPT